MGKMIACKSQSYVLVPGVGVVVVDGMDWLRKQVGVNVLSSNLVVHNNFVSEASFS